MNKQTSTSTFTQIRMGALFLNDVVQAIPENPVWDGDIAQYDGSSAITIQDAPSEMSSAWITWNVVPGMKRWTTQENCDTLLVADRVLLTNVSWKDLAANGFAKGQVVTLNGRDFLCRLVPVGTAPNGRNVWNDALNATTKENDVWHWKGVYFWGDVYKSSMKRCAMRGNTSVCGWSDGKTNKRSPHIGFRPVLEPLAGDDILVYPASDSPETSKSEKKTAPQKTYETTAVPVKTKTPRSKVASPAAKMLAEALLTSVDKEFVYQDRRYIVRPNGSLWTFASVTSGVRRWIRVVDVNKIADLVNRVRRSVKTPSFSKAEKDMVNHLATIFGADWLLGKTVIRSQDGSLEIVGDKDFRMPLSNDSFPSVKPGYAYSLQDVA